MDPGELVRLQQAGPLKYTMIENIITFPIVVIANYRTGSSNFVLSLAKKYKLIGFNEPHTRNKKKAEILEVMICRNMMNFAVKFMPEQLVNRHHDVYQKVMSLENSFKIKLTRRDITSQVLSYYIAKMSHRFEERSNDKVTSYHVELNEDVLDYSIERIMINNELFTNLDINFDKEIHYEDLVFVDSEFVKTTPPLNYDEVFYFVDTKLKERNIS